MLEPELVKKFCHFAIYEFRTNDYYYPTYKHYIERIKVSMRTHKHMLDVVPIPLSEFCYNAMCGIANEFVKAHPEYELELFPAGSPYALLISPKNLQSNTSDNYSKSRWDTKDQHNDRTSNSKKDMPLSTNQ